MATFGIGNTVINGGIIEKRTSLLLFMPLTVNVKEYLESNDNDNKYFKDKEILQLYGLNSEETLLEILKNIGMVDYIIFDSIRAGVDILNHYHIPLTVAGIEDINSYIGQLYLGKVPIEDIDYIVSNWDTLMHDDFIDTSNSIYSILRRSGTRSYFTNCQHTKKTAVLCNNKNFSIHQKVLYKYRLMFDSEYLLYDTTLFNDPTVLSSKISQPYNIALMKEQMILQSDIVLFATVKILEARIKEEDYEAVFDEDVLRELKFAQDNKKEIRFIYY